MVQKPGAARSRKQLWHHHHYHLHYYNINYNNRNNGTNNNRINTAKLKVVSLKEVWIASQVAEDLWLRSPRLETLELLLIAPIPNLVSSSEVSASIPPYVATSYWELFDFENHLLQVIETEQRRIFQEEIIQILTCCHARGFGQTLKKPRVIIPGDDDTKGTMGDLVQLCKWRPHNNDKDSGDLSANTMDAAIAKATLDYHVDMEGAVKTSWG